MQLHYFCQCVVQTVKITQKDTAGPKQLCKACLCMHLYFCNNSLSRLQCWSALISNRIVHHNINKANVNTKQVPTHMFLFMFGSKMFISVHTKLNTNSSDAMWIFYKYFFPVCNVLYMQLLKYIRAASCFNPK